MQVLITGGAGFLGSRLANALDKQGHYVRVLDNLSSGDPESLTKSINFNRGDVSDIPKLWSLLYGIDVVYHLAARVSVPASVLYPREYNEVNVGGTVALLEACRDVKVKRVVFGSSATVYGNQEVQPVSESMWPRPEVPYAVSKLAAEQYLFTVGQNSGFETVALRIFNAYGPGQHMPPAHPPVVPQFIHQTIGRGSLVVAGNGEQTRDFVYVDDVVAALISAGSMPGVDHKIINVGSGTETSINELIRQIGATVGVTPSVLYDGEAGGGLPRLVADISRARRLLKWQPRVDLATGLKHLYDEDPAIKLYRTARSHADTVNS